jgi:hypothetical protein
VDSTSTVWGGKEGVAGFLSDWFGRKWNPFPPNFPLRNIPLCIRERETSSSLIYRSGGSGRSLEVVKFIHSALSI